MIDILSIVTIFLVSLFLAIKASKKELAIPDEVKNIKISRNEGKLSGVIIFLKEKIIHYSSRSSSSS